MRLRRSFNEEKLQRVYYKHFTIIQSWVITVIHVAILNNSRKEQEIGSKNTRNSITKDSYGHNSYGG